MATETRYHYLASYMPFYLFFTRSLHLVRLTANHEAEEKRKKKDSYKQTHRFNPKMKLWEITFKSSHHIYKLHLKSCMETQPTMTVGFFSLYKWLCNLLIKFC